MLYKKALLVGLRQGLIYKLHHVPLALNLEKGRVNLNLDLSSDMSQLNLSQAILSRAC